jgi:hypothetical protein
MLNILKKYSRAAGDRSQWKKVEAMIRIPKSAESAESKFWGEQVTWPDPAFVVL